MDERWEAATTVMLNLLYVGLAMTMLVMMVPNLRARLGVFGGQQVYAWRYGRWLGSKAPTPQWTRLLEREDLPQESA